MPRRSLLANCYPCACMCSPCRDVHLPSEHGFWVQQVVSGQHRQKMVMEEDVRSVFDCSHMWNMGAFAGTQLDGGHQLANI